MTKDLGPQPEPQIDPAEPYPGGVDAVEFDAAGEPQIPNLPADMNPAVGDDTPDEVTEGEDTSTAATESEAGENEGQDPEGSPV